MYEPREEKAMASQKIAQTTSRFSLGVEEEFQTVDRETGLLTPYVHTALEKIPDSTRSTLEQVL